MPCIVFTYLCTPCTHVSPEVGLLLYTISDIIQQQDSWLSTTRPGFEQCLDAVLKRYRKALESLGRSAALIAQLVRAFG